MFNNRQQENGPASRGYRLRRLITVLLSALLFGNLSIAESAEELVSLKCARAIEAALAELNELDQQAENLIIIDVLSKIDDVNGQMVCIPMNASEIQVRLQSTDMGYSDNRLVFSIDAKTYTVLKTFYGR
jgi:hypothetical protein